MFEEEIFDNMNDFQEANPELAEEILKTFDLDNWNDPGVEIEFVENDELVNYETICGVLGKKINQKAVDYLFDIGVDYVLVLFFDEKIGSMFAPMTCCEASVFEYINNKHGSSLRSELCANRDNNGNTWSHFESE